MASAIYRAVMKGKYGGQAIINNLAYRVGVGVDVAGFAIGGAQALANCIKDQVWPKMKDVLTSGYTLESIIVYPQHGETFELLYQNPFELPVLENGSNADTTNGPASCLIYKFNLEATAVSLNGIFPPKRGYIAVGPLQEEMVDNSGNVSNALFTDNLSSVNALATALAANLESLIPPVIFFPIRVKQQKILGIWKTVSFADVGGCAARHQTSFRRSRMME